MTKWRKPLKTLVFYALLWYNFVMENKKFTEQELNNFPKEIIIKMYLQLTESMDRMSMQIENLTEQVAILTQHRFGRKTEKASEIPSAQITMEELFSEDMSNIFNEAELTADENASEPDYETIVYKRRKRTGKRAEDISLLEVVVDETITIPDEELEKRFPEGYKRLPDEVYNEVEFIPARFLVHEKHIAVYAGNNNSGIVKAKRPERLLKNSLLSTSIAAGVIDAKYVNHIPLNRLSEDFRRKDFNVSKQNLANWMIEITERYLIQVYRYMKKELLKSKLIHCDETPFKLVNNGRGPSSKDYMWLFHTCPRYGSPDIYLYHYDDGKRNTDVLLKFLEDYAGILLTDGYTVYHSAENKSQGKLTVAGCWTHARRRYADFVKGVGTEGFKGTIADEAIKRIQAIYHTENMIKGKDKKYVPTDEEILRNRQVNVKPLVDSYFEWIKSIAGKPNIDKGNSIYSAINYSINQEKFLREFLENPLIPLDNNDAERSIKSFCVSKHSWHVITSKRGAGSSAILYSIAETAKANNLKTFEYFKYLLDQILIHVEDSPETYIEDLMPWSDALPDSLRKKQ